ncbi:MAG: transglycosylase [Tardiphaga sp.]|nr:transglycosylase [Tardiphaga sp.]
MRLVLMSSTVVLAMFLEMNSVPFLKISGFDSEATASQITGDKVSQPGSDDDTLRDDRGIAAQVASLRKSDRLFVTATKPAANDLGATASAAIVEDEAAIAAPPPQLTIGEFCEALAEAAEASDIPVAFFARLIWQESKFKHDATSHVGAQGVAQFMPRTAAEMGLDDPFDPRKALPASAKFLRKLHDQFGNLGLAAAAYNAGSGRIQNWLARRGPLPDETRNYVRKITGNPAETWTSEKKTAALQQELPREAPCEGVGGLSRNKETASMAVELTPGISGMIHKAEAEAARAVAAAKAKARLLLAKAGKHKAVASTVVAANAGKPEKKTVIIAVTNKASATKVAALGRVKARDAQAERRIKVASAR